MPASWFEVTVDVPRSQAEAVANFLIEMGAPGLESREQGEHVRLVAYFRTAPSPAAISRYCREIGWKPCSDGEVRLRSVADTDWTQGWKQHVRPHAVGSRLFVCPSWQAQRPADRIAIVIDPGMAFGTGAHASTRGCLTLLEAAAAEREIRRALDVGTGSGILAIALAKLGAAEVWAVDTDPLARAVAAENATGNAVATRLQFVEHLEHTTPPWDVIVANLYANLLEELSRHLMDALDQSGTLIVSGFIAEDEPRLRAVYEACGALVTKRWEEEEWVTLAWSRAKPA